MKRFLGTRIGIILTISIIAVLSISLVAQAALNLNKPIPATANIKSATANVLFGADSVFNTVITSLNFGDVEQGNTKAVTVWYRNMGAYTLNSISFSVIGLDPTAASLTIGTPSSTTLAAGATGSVVFTFVPVDNGPTGVTPFTINFNSTN